MAIVVGEHFFTLSCRVKPGSRQRNVATGSHTIFNGFVAATVAGIEIISIPATNSIENCMTSCRNVTLSLYCEPGLIDVKLLFQVLKFVVSASTLFKLFISKQYTITLSICNFSDSARSLMPMTTRSRNISSFIGR